MRRRWMLVGVVLVMGLAGCAPSPKPSPPAASTVTVAPSPASTVTVTATATPTTTAPTATGKGCSNGSTTIPPGASTATITDVDGDGRADTEFYSEAASPFTYGIRTAAGGVYTIRDGLAGPGAHSGWTAAFDATPGHLTVIDDGRTAELYAFIGCRFVRTADRAGKPYDFGLNGFYEAGTGVACNDRNGGTLLEGVLARKRSDGKYDIRWTQIDVSADGATATNGATETRWSGLAASDSRVRASMESHCGSAPKVGTSGR